MQTVYQNPYDERPVGGGSGNHTAATNTMSSFNSHEDRPIGGSKTGAYDLDSIPLEEMEVEDNYNEVELATLDHQ